MNLQRRDFLLVVILAGAAATPAWGQLVAPPGGAGGQRYAKRRIHAGFFFRHLGAPIPRI